MLPLNSEIGHRGSKYKRKRCKDKEQRYDEGKCYKLSNPKTNNIGKTPSIEKFT